MGYGGIIISVYLAASTRSCQAPIGGLWRGSKLNVPALPLLADGILPSGSGLPELRF